MLIFRSAKANAAALGLLLRASRKWGAWWGKNKTKFIRGVKEDAGIVLLIGAGASQLGLLGLWALSAFGGQGAWPQGGWQKAGLLSGALAGCALWARALVASMRAPKINNDEKAKQMAFLWAEPVWEAWRSQWGARWNQMKDARGIGLLVRSLEQIIWGLAFPWQALMLALQCSLGTLMVSMLFIFALVFVFPIAYSVMRAMEGWEKARIWAGVPGEARFGAGFEAVRLKAEGKISAWVDELAKEGKSGYIEAEEQALRDAALAPRAKGSVSRAQRV